MELYIFLMVDMLRVVTMRFFPEFYVFYKNIKCIRNRQDKSWQPILKTSLYEVYFDELVERPGNQLEQTEPLVSFNHDIGKDV